MPQEHQVLRCYKCRIFQVQLVKKKPKWECKMCHEKQSTKKIFMKSESAKDCRIMVQELNLSIKNMDDTIQENLDDIQKLVTYTAHHIGLEKKDEINYQENKMSKWIRFLDCNVNTVEECAEQSKEGSYKDKVLSCKNNEDQNCHEYQKRQKLGGVVKETEYLIENKCPLTTQLKYVDRNFMSKKKTIFEHNADDLNLEF